MYAGQGLPTWIVAALSGYSPQQVAQALKWAMNNLDPVMLQQYYKWAEYYRPALRRDLQGMVDAMGRKVEANKMRYHNGPMQTNTHSMGFWDEHMPSMPDAGAGAAGGGAGGKQGADIFGQITKGISNIAQTAGAVAGAYAQTRCAVDPMAPGCPGSNQRPPGPGQHNPYGNQASPWGYGGAPPPGGQRPGGGYQDHWAGARIPGDPGYADFDDRMPPMQPPQRQPPMRQPTRTTPATTTTRPVTTTTRNPFAGGSQGMSQNTKNMLMIGGLGVAALLLLR